MKVKTFGFDIELLEFLNIFLKQGIMISKSLGEIIGVGVKNKHGLSYVFEKIYIGKNMSLDDFLNEYGGKEFIISGFSNEITLPKDRLEWEVLKTLGGWCGCL